MMKLASLGFATLSLFVSGTTHAAQNFDPIKDCAVQPWGLSPGVVAGDDSNEMMPEIPATNEPDFLPQWQIKDTILQIARPMLGDKADEIANLLNGVCVSKQNHALYLSIYFKQYMFIELKNYGLAKKMEPYRIDSPATLRLRVTKAGPQITADILGRRGSVLQILAKIPVISDRIYLHRLVVDLNTQWAQIYLGKMKDRLGFVMWTQFDPDAPFKIHLNLWQTLRRLFRPAPPLKPARALTATN